MAKSPLHDTLRQMLAVLEEERQALAGLDLDAIVGTTQNKERLCLALDALDVNFLDEDARAMLESARRMNEVNRQVRNIIAANVSRRLTALTGGPQTYRPVRTYQFARAS